MASSVATEASARVLITYSMFARTGGKHFVRASHMHVQLVRDTALEYQGSLMFCSEGHIEIGSPQEEISKVPFSVPLVNLHYIILSVFFPVQPSGQWRFKINACIVILCCPSHSLYTAAIMADSKPGQPEDYGKTALSSEVSV